MRRRLAHRRLLIRFNEGSMTERVNTFVDVDRTPHEAGGNDAHRARALLDDPRPILADGQVTL